MGTKKLLAAASGLIAGALLLSACTPPSPGATTGQTAAPEKTSVSVMWNQAFYTANTATTFGNATANANIMYLTNDTVNYYDKALNIVNNKSYGTYEKVSDDPMTIKQTVADTATWSDGTPVTAADLLLQWAATSTHFNNVKGDEITYDDETGEIKTDLKGSNVYFDASLPSATLIKDFPVIGDNGKSITYTYSKPFADWEKTLLGGAATFVLPAHIIGKRALDVTDPTEAANAVVKAFQDKDNASLAKIANSWNTDWNFTSMPEDKDLVVGTGPYSITDFKKDQYMTLSKNANYKGEHTPAIDEITIRWNEDPMAAVQALQNGEVQLISPQSTADVLKAAQALPDATVLTGEEGTYEHVDTIFDNGGPFDPKTYGGDAEKAKKVRQAFLLTIPRQQIVDTIIKPLNPNASVRNSFNVVPGSPNYEAVVAANGMSTAYADVDIDKAKALLAEAGVKSPSVRMLYAKPHPRRVQEFQLIKESAEKAGFKLVDGGRADWGAQLGTTSKYDASLFGWQSTSTAVTESEANFRTGGGNNFGGYSSKEVDGLYDKLVVSVDPAEQKALNEQIEKILVDDAFGITLFQFPTVTAYSSALTGVDPITLSPTIFWNFWEWKA